MRKVLGAVRQTLQPALRAVGSPACNKLATAYRSLFLRRVTFIGVTGSTGKTTTKELIAGALGARLRGSKSIGNRNIDAGICRAVLAVRPWQDFHVQELACATGGKAVPLERPLAVMQPRIGVVTNVGSDHLSVFGSIEAIAREKGKMFDALTPDAIAVINLDDPLVAEMRSRCRARVITHGTGPDADLRAENVSCQWPGQPLRFEVVYGGGRHTVTTQLWGKHWTPCVLAALATALAAGVCMEDALRGIADVGPVDGRMMPETRLDGVTFIRDAFKAPLGSIRPALEFLRDVDSGARKIAVIGSISDYRGDPPRVYSQVANDALDVADVVLFVGRNASKSSRARTHPRARALHSFVSAEKAAAFLGSVLRPGDVVLVKGGWEGDHLEKLLDTPIAADNPVGASHGTAAECGSPSITPPYRIVIGLGNGAFRYRDTPHNVGHRVLDRLASRLGCQWRSIENASTTAGLIGEQRLHLVKTAGNINQSGRIIHRLAEDLDFTGVECILIHDDLDLSIGDLRVRLKGSDGGHRGVRSVLEALGTEHLARVKVGIRPREPVADAGNYVLRPFEPGTAIDIDKVCEAAVDEVLALVAARAAGSDIKARTLRVLDRADDSVAV